ncbi:transposable element Tc1 transposase [Trichonephila clavipes]|nr:transposable element Tc1 transposase [Trichonephila clavipes]
MPAMVGYLNHWATAAPVKIGSYSARSPDFSPIEPIWDMMEMRLYLPRNSDDLARELELTLQEILQDTIRVFYHSMPRRVAACIRARVGSTPY